MTRILNPKAKEQYDADNAKYQVEMKEIMGMNGKNHAQELLNSHLWLNINEYFPNMRRLEIFNALKFLVRTGFAINLHASNLDEAMCWEDTNQGHEYWRQIHHIYLDNKTEDY